jgi:hypothetical protein
MKKSFLISASVALISLSIISCSKEDDNTNSSVYSDIVADEIAASSSIVSMETSDVSTYYAEYNISTKAATLDTVYHKSRTFNKSDVFPFTYSFSFSVDYGVVLNSNDAIDNLYCNSAITGSLNNAVVKVNLQESSKWVATGFGLNEDNYVLNGTGNLKANSRNKVLEDTIISSSSLKFSNINIDKTTDEITSGTINWEISGTVNGEYFKYSAVFVYKGNNEAELTLNNNKYYVNITTGKVEE